MYELYCVYCIYNCIYAIAVSIPFRLFSFLKPLCDAIQRAHSRTKASARFTSIQHGLFLFLFIKYILLFFLPVIFWSNHFAICFLILLQNFLFSSWESSLPANKFTIFSPILSKFSYPSVESSQLFLKFCFNRNSRSQRDYLMKFRSKKKRSWKKLMQRWLKTNTLHRMFFRRKGTMRERERDREGEKEGEGESSRHGFTIVVRSRKDFAKGRRRTRELKLGTKSSPGLH